jgi:8-oxo-dGTP pyrophosphatase MutT (NUDIX family)
VVLIEQFRHGTEEVTLEIPGGIVDRGEDPLAAGLRELREETGYEGGEARLIGRVTPNPAIMNNHCHTVLVRGARRAGAQQLESNEEIAVRLEPRERIDGLVRGGSIEHALVVAAFHHLALLEEE